MFSTIYSVSILLCFKQVIAVVQCPVGLKCCDPLTDPTNGHVSYCKNDTVCPVGTVVSYWCDSSYQLQGSPTLTCQSIGGPGVLSLSDVLSDSLANRPGYSAPPPVCIGDLNYCEKLKQPANAYPLGICTQIPCYRGTYVAITCKDGFKVASGSAIVCNQQLGKSGWSEEPKCISNEDFLTPVLDPLKTVLQSIFGNQKL